MSNTERSNSGKTYNLIILKKILMKKIFSFLASASIVLSSFAFALPAEAAALPNWDLTGTWTFDDIYGGDNFHTMNITSFDTSTGAFSGTGFYKADPSLTWTINGVESGNNITYQLYVLTVAPGVTLDGVGTIDGSGLSMSGTGTQTNLPSGGPVTWTAIGVAHAITYVNKVGPVTSSSLDGSSCGGTWANDTYSLFFAVTANGDGTYGVQTFYKNGAFTTTGGASPGSCSDSHHHGSTVTAGIKGKFQGFVKETVTASSFDPGVCNIPANCTGRDAFVNVVFGSPSQNNFSWNFEYNSSDKTLTYRHWQDKSNTAGENVFEGDIANN
jgi:hypothetical protein